MNALLRWPFSGMIISLLAGTLLFGLVSPVQAGDLLPEAPKYPKKILFFSKCNEYEDPMVHRIGGQLSPAEQILFEMGKELRIKFTFTKEGSAFTRDNLAKYDAFIFFTSGDLTQSGSDGTSPLTPEGKQALLQAIADGKGFMGIHSAANTFTSGPHGLDPFIQMLGGELRVRVRGMEPAHQIVVDTNFPGMEFVPANFAPVEEWYSLKNFASDLHVLLAQDTDSMVRGSYYAPNYPSTWAHFYHKGRVFYTSMGHQRELWNSPVFQQILTGGIRWTVGYVSADVSPNLNSFSKK